MLLREIKNIFHTELDVIYGQEETASFFYLLIAHYFNLERFILVVQPDYIITKEQESLIFEALSQLKEEKPIQYIMGTAHFMEMDLKVGPGVLIPRPETEELVRWILSDVKTSHRPITILDMGTGSGCIPIALAKFMKNVNLKALDISTEALNTAKMNAKANKVDVDFFQADILDLDLDLDLEFDIIVSNPPYVRMQEKVEMRNNVKDHEPDIALFVEDENPLLFYGHILNFGEHNLSQDGWIFLEINQYLGKEMIELLKNYNFKDIELRKDMFGNDRMLKARKG
ncbi:peptide chain release factor N(5)-glutamine methyltransferase [Maribacter sp. 2304DJ31-5]|uniref:peptide chain release factor N(5)-glutamine methyltransferase n=1 Tax=Maribacter sp. 2304DJ31-5 TaxID=3386273 RepID=UPI0039BD146C